jgi:hypothetical protein
MVKETTWQENDLDRGKAASSGFSLLRLWKSLCNQFHIQIRLIRAVGDQVTKANAETGLKP